MTKHKAIYLEWDDARGRNGWFSNDEILNGPFTIKTIGYLVKEDRTHITVTTSISKSDYKVDPLTIPKSTILKRRNIKIKI